MSLIVTKSKLFINPTNMLDLNWAQNSLQPDRVEVNFETVAGARYASKDAELSILGAH